jgi:hypothetical protein
VAMTKRTWNPLLSFSEINSINALRQVNNVPVGKTGNTRIKGQIPVYEEPILKPVENIEKNLENSDETKPEELIIEGLMEKVLAEQFNLLLYPNPANNEVNILYNAGNEQGYITIEILDITGRLIDSYKANAENNILKINTQKYNRVYIILHWFQEGKDKRLKNL